MVNKIPQSLLLDSVTTAPRSISAPPIWLVMLTSHLHERRCQVITVIAHTSRQIRTYCVVRLSLILLRLINVLHVFSLRLAKLLESWTNSLLCLRTEIWRHTRVILQFRDVITRVKPLIYLVKISCIDHGLFRKNTAFDYKKSFICHIYFYAICFLWLAICVRKVVLKEL